VARAAFPKGNAYLRMHDELGRLYADRDFAALFPTRGQPALAPAQLALVTLMQFAENLSDRQAADAVRARIDWKYALCLELEDPGFDASVLCEFRARLLAGGLRRSSVNPYERLVFPWPVRFLAQPVKGTSVLKNTAAAPIEAGVALALVPHRLIQPRYTS
jgi:hypothetical protein